MPPSYPKIQEPTFSQANQAGSYILSDSYTMKNILTEECNFQIANLSITTT